MAAVETIAKCKHCRGSGRIAKSTTCQTCKGAARVRVTTDAAGRIVVLGPAEASS